MFNNIYLLFIIIVSVHGLDCGEWPPYDQQLMLNTMNGFSNATYTFECCGALGCTKNSGPTYDCNSIGICNYQSPVLCINNNTLVRVVLVVLLIGHLILPVHAHK
jgi:hypothetical protein